MDRHIAELSQRAGVLEPLTSCENKLFRRGRYPIGRLARAGRPIAPLDPVQPLLGSPRHPSRDGRPADMELMRDLSSAASRPNGRNDGTALPFDGVFLPPSLLCGYLEEILFFPKTLAKSKPSATRLWKLTGYGKPPSTAPSHTPWKTLRVSHSSHSVDPLQIEKELDQKPATLARSF
jgi:hypothetical protein